MANLYTYTCDRCAFTGIFRENNSMHCPCCNAWPMKEITADDVDDILAQIDSVMGDYDDEDIEAMAIEMADKANRRAAVGK